MRVLVTASFKAPFGGLQANVRAQLRAIRQAESTPVLACDAGRFAEAVRSEGFEVIDGDLLSAEVHRRCVGAGPFDLIHAHPFAARQLGLAVATELGLPMLVTLHGNYTDSLSEYHSAINYVVVVSRAIRDRLLATIDIAPEKVLVIPNGTDTDLFFPAATAAGDRDEEESKHRSVFLASRFDHDKAFIVDLIVETWNLQATKRAFDIRWVVAGDGADISRLHDAAATLEGAAETPLVEFLGWQSEAALADAYRSADLVVAPGRSVIDCMATATPVIAVGSQGYVGPMLGETAIKGAYENFGGGGSKHEQYLPGSMFADVDTLAFDDDARAEASALGLALVDAYFRQDDVDRQLISLYQTLRRTTTPSRHAFDYEEVAADLPGLGFCDDTQGVTALAPTWQFPITATRKIEAGPNGDIRATVSSDDGPFYLAAESTDFSRPPTSSQWAIEPSKSFRLAASLLSSDPGLDLDIWVVQYNGQKRLRSASTRLEPGRTALSFTTGPETNAVKVAVRFAGQGSAHLGPLGLTERIERWKPVAPTRRPPSGRLSSYAGEDLIFILGAPRSGTTWLLRLIAEHPAVAAATVDNLALRVNDNETLETNVFNEARGFTDSQLRRAFHRLGQRSSGDVIVEKTPIHLLYTDRIRRVFPEAALVLTARHPLAVVNSLLHVGRSKDSWWKGAPAEPSAAVQLWMKYEEAADRCRELHQPIQIRYETLVEDTAATLDSLLSQLGLDRGSIASQIDAAAQGKGVPMRGAFRDGSVDSWRRELTESELNEILEVGSDLLRTAMRRHDSSSDGGSTPPQSAAAPS